MGRMATNSDRWVSVAAARQAQSRHVRHEAAAGLAAGVLSFAFVLAWSLPEGDSPLRIAALEGIALALGASISVWVQHVKTLPGELRKGLTPTAWGLLRFARGVALLGALATLVYYWG